MNGISVSQWCIFVNTMVMILFSTGRVVSWPVERVSSSQELPFSSVSQAFSFFPSCVRQGNLPALVSTDLETTRFRCRMLVRGPRHCFFWGLCYNYWQLFSHVIHSMLNVRHSGIHQACTHCFSCKISFHWDKKNVISPRTLETPCKIVGLVSPMKSWIRIFILNLRSVTKSQQIYYIVIDGSTDRCWT